VDLLYRDTPAVPNGEVEGRDTWVSTFWAPGPHVRTRLG